MSGAESSMNKIPAKLKKLVHQVKASEPLSKSLTLKIATEKPKQSGNLSAKPTSAIQNPRPDVN
jgi:hypothetical protein